MSSVANDGSIRITPALSAAEIDQFHKGLKSLVKSVYKTMAFGRSFDAVTDPARLRVELGIGLEITETTREVEEGTLHVRTAGVLSFAHDSSEPRVGFVSVVELLKETFPDRLLEGQLISVNEERTSATKVFVAATGQIVTVLGNVKVLWSDNSEPTELRALV